MEESKVIEEGNEIELFEIVRVFMGYEIKRGNQLAHYKAGGNTTYLVGENFTVTEAEWNPKENWNHLMPVVEKIEDFARVDIYGKACKISQPQWTVDIARIDEKKIMAVWQCVIQFIQWFNTAKQIT